MTLMTQEDQWPESRFTGIFTTFGEIQARPFDPAVFMWGATAVSSNAQNKVLNIGGAGWTKQAAKMACIGETIERFQASPLAEDIFIKSSFNSWPIDETLINPQDWVLFHPDQYKEKGFPFLPFTNDTVCHWVCFRAFDTGTPVWIPEEMAYLFPRQETSCSTSHHSLCPSISTGLSAGKHGHPILLRGLQEVIERDGIVGAWWGSYPLEEWDQALVFSLIDKQFTANQLKQKIIRPNLKYRFYRVNSPYSSNITIVTVEGEDLEGYCFSAGTACRETLEESWLKAILESLQGKYFVRYLKSQMTAKPVLPQDFPEHAVYYSFYREKLSSTVLYKAKQITQPITNTAVENLKVLSKRLGSKHPILFRNMTPKAIAETTPWIVLKVVVPGLQPLYSSHSTPSLGGKLWSPRTLKDWAKMLPHPFA